MHSQRIEGYEKLSVLWFSRPKCVRKPDQKELIKFITNEWQQYYLELGIKKLYAKKYGFGKMRCGVIARHSYYDYGAFFPIEMNYVEKLNQDSIEKYLLFITKYLKEQKSPCYVTHNGTTFGLHPQSTLFVGNVTGILSFDKDMECREVGEDWSFSPNSKETFKF